MKPLLLAVFCAVLAAPALAGTPPAPEPAKFDFTERPPFRPYAALPPRDAAKPMKVEESKILADNLFAAYLNIGGLSRFRFHVRTKDEKPMTAEELDWAEKELTKNMAVADGLLTEAQAALKVGLERKPPLPDSMKEWGSKLKGGLMLGRAKMGRRVKPTFEDYRQEEHGAMGGVMLDLYELVKSGSDRLAEVEPEDVAKVEKVLAKDLEELAEARKGMEGAAKEADAQGKNGEDKLEGARKRAAKAAGAGPKGGSTAKGAGQFLEDRNKAAGKDGDAGVRDSGKRISPEEAAREANAAELRAANKKKGRSPAIVPAP